MNSFTELRLTIEFEDAWHHGSGHGLAGVVDRAVLRDGAGQPYLAGSAVKGRFRHTALRLLRSRGERTCDGSGDVWCRGDEPCRLCRLFGSPRRAGRAEFGDVVPAPEEMQLLRALTETSASPVFAGGSHVRTQTALQRTTRTVMPEHLFTTEVITTFRRLNGLITGRLSGDDVDLLTDCARLIETFGGDSTRGLGFCHCTMSAAAEVQS
jgi:CRISPR/Cas system CSM-associated protein Csm3 (group 7 of RAMP superfamily)